ncbi:glycosyltransferase [uncultured Amnibacterium sp.]|uniref:glycosyltransferase n=1 Tax=uncultured Amnibacterium sp. TaxID=1631851 RepID=UPI0035CA547D
MTDRAARLTVLQSFPERSAATNPYLLQLVDALRRADPDLRVVGFGWRAALLGRVDVFHVHWPERLVRGSSPLRTALRRAAFLLFLLRIAATGVAVVRTVHNLDSHERGGSVERMLLRALDRRVTVRVRLNPFTPMPDGAVTRTILHGHYRDWFAAPTHSPVRGRLLFFGLVRPYKGIEELIDAFRGVRDARASLHIVGGAQDAALTTTLRSLVDQDPRVQAHWAYLPDDDLRNEIGEAELVVLPYRSVHNSGAALLALSLERPVLMPSADTTEWLQAEVGADWLPTYGVQLTAVELQSALARVRARTTAQPGLTDRDWGPIAHQHIEAYETALRRVGRPRARPGA